MFQSFHHSQNKCLLTAEKITLNHNATIIYQYVLDLGVLISGGYGYGGYGEYPGYLKSVEVYIPASNTTCSLPQQPGERVFHTQDGELACGGGFGSSLQTTCVKWSSDSGSWSQSHTLRQERTQHVSLATEDGVYLMGGQDSSSWRTTELVKEDGSVEDGFSLKYDTR